MREEALTSSAVAPEAAMYTGAKLLVTWWNGRDYSCYLARKRPESSLPSRGVCHKCSVLFQRLDTHLRLGATRANAPANAHPVSPAHSGQSTDSSLSQSTAAAHAFKHPLGLPKTTEDGRKLTPSSSLQWFQQPCRPSQQRRRTPSLVMVLTGTHSPPHSQRKAEVKLRQHNRALENVTRRI